MTNPIPHTVDAGGLKLRLWQYPTSDETAQEKFKVLFLHGYYDTGRSFDSLITYLDPKIQAWSLDFRGHGQSERAPPGASYHLLDHVKDTFYAIEHLNQQNIEVDLLFGHSMGGNIALILAGSVPEKIKGLMLLDNLGAPAEDSREQPARLGIALQAMLQEYPPHFCYSQAEAIAKLQKNNPYLSLEGATRMAKHMLSPDPQQPGRLLFAFDPRLRGPAPHRYPEETWQTFCARVKGPTWILQAENGYAPKEGEYMNRLQSFSNAQFFTIPNVGHHLHVDTPEIVAKYVNQYAE